MAEPLKSVSEDILEGVFINGLEEESATVRIHLEESEELEN